MVCSLKESPLDLSNATMKGEVEFRSPIAGAIDFELTLMGLWLEWLDDRDDGGVGSSLPLLWRWLG